MRKRTGTLLLLFLFASLHGAEAFISSSSGRKASLTLARAKHDGVVVIALTREVGKNEKLGNALRLKPALEPFELPCIAHADGEDYPKLRQALQFQEWFFVVVTSPEGAKVLASACEGLSAIPPVAAVGKATEEALEEYGIRVSFCPSKATAKTLAEELPGEAGKRILYPASKRAQETLEKGLSSRGFRVTRLNTYDTVTATWTDLDRQKAGNCRVVCFASPSAVKGWLLNSDQKTNILAACIGETSARACSDMGWDEKRIFYPEKPGIEGWVEAIDKAVESLRVAQTYNR